jgi:hypothetical protein
MVQVFFAYWWLLFPLAWFVAGGWHSWLAYQRRKHELDIIKTYAAQGKDPPPEIAKAISGDAAVNPQAQPNGNGYGPYGYYGGWRGRRWGWGWSPYWAWHRAIVCAAVAGGLYYWANYYNHDEHATGGVMIAVIVLGVIAVSSAVMALVQTLNPPK